MATAATLEERDVRIERIRGAMAAKGLDGLIVGGKGHWWTGRGYVRYLTDFHLWGHDALILLPADGEPAMTISSDALAGMIARRGWLEDTAGDVLLWPGLVARVRDRGLEAGRIGIVGAPSIIAADVLRDLRAGLGKADLVAADALLDDVRAAKSPLEIAQNREVWTLARACLERFAAILEPGVPARELAADVTGLALAGGARDVLVLVADRSDVYGPPGAAPFALDDLVRFHIEICGESGHWCEVTITVAFRPVRDDERRLMAAELAAMEAVRAAARPGVRLAALSACYDESLRGAGYGLGAPTRHFDFHGQGLDVIERPWFAAEQPWGSTGDGPLPAGAVLSYHPRRHVEPAVAWTTGVSDDLLVTGAGGEWLGAGWDHTWREASG